VQVTSKAITAYGTMDAEGRGEEEEEVVIKFKPLETFVLDGSLLYLRIPTGPGETMYVMELRGRARAPAVEFSFRKHDFKSCYIQRMGVADMSKDDEAGNVAILEITNRDTSDVLITPDFEPEQDSEYMAVSRMVPHQKYLEDKDSHFIVECNSCMIPAGGRVEVLIRFAPREVRLYEAKQVCFRINDFKREWVWVTGRGVPLRLELLKPSMQSVNFGTITGSESVSRTIVVVNRGPKKCVFKLAGKGDLSARDVSWTGEGQEKIPLNPREQMPITFHFAPKTSQNLVNEVFQAVMEGGEPVDICQLNGKAHTTLIRLSETTVNFNKVVIPSQSSSKVVMHNYGDLGSKFSWENINGAGVVAVEPMDGFIKPGGDQDFMVFFKPQSPADKGQFILQCNLEMLPHEPQRLHVNGMAEVMQASGAQTEQVSFSAMVFKSDKKPLEAKWTQTKYMSQKAAVIRPQVSTDPDNFLVCKKIPEGVSEDDLRAVFAEFDDGVSTGPLASSGARQSCCVVAFSSPEQLKQCMDGWRRITMDEDLQPDDWRKIVKLDKIPSQKRDFWHGPYVNDRQVNEVPGKGDAEQKVATFDVIYKPLTTTEAGGRQISYNGLRLTVPSAVKHTGTCIVPTPDGEVTQYKLIGDAARQTDADEVSIPVNVPYKKRHTVRVPVENWLHKRQRFTVRVEQQSVEPAADARTLTILGLGEKQGDSWDGGSWDLPGSLTRDYLLTVYAYKKLNSAKLVLTFTNDEGESKKVAVLLQFEEPSSIGEVISLDTSCRREVTHALLPIVENPLDEPATFTCKAELPDGYGGGLKFKIKDRETDTFTVPAKGQELVNVSFCPSAETSTQLQGKVTLSSEQLGEYKWDVKFRVGPAGLEKTVECECPIGKVDGSTTSFDFKANVAGAKYTAKFVKAPGRCDNEVKSFAFSNNKSQEATLDATSGKDPRIEGGIMFTPTSMRESRAKLIITSDANGSYEALITGKVRAPEPIGPFDIAKGAAVKFKNPFNDTIEFKLQVDNPERFQFVSPDQKTQKVAPLADVNVALKYNPVPAGEKKPTNGRLLVSSVGVPTPWVFFLKGEEPK